VNQLDLVLVEKTTKEFARGKTKSALKEGSHHYDFVGVGSGYIFILNRTPLEDGTGGEKMIPDKLKKGALIHG
jgi:hypothetical protein